MQDEPAWGGAEEPSEETPGRRPSQGRHPSSNPGGVVGGGGNGERSPLGPSPERALPGVEEETEPAVVEDAASLLPGLQDRYLVAALASARIGLGVSMLVAPGPLARLWLGEDATSPAATALARSVAARDLALGLGTLLALRRGRPTRGWLEATALADAGDAMASLLSWGQLPPVGGIGIVVVAAGAAWLNGVLARRPSSGTVEET